MDYNLSDINCIKRLLEPRGFNFSKSLGQNFLVDPEVCPAMAELLEAERHRSPGDRSRYRRAD